MNKFEQLIEYVINDEEAKARELFHDIVVEKSRAIYEEMMQEEEELDEAESTEKEDERAERAGRKVAKDIEYDDRKDRAMKESADEDIDEALGGDQADDLIDDVETEEQGMAEDDDDMDMDGDDHHADVGGEEELEDRVVDLEDKLDELMAEFEALMGDQDGQGDEEVDMDVDVEDDGMGMDMTGAEVVDDEFETEGVMEATNLKPVPKPTHGDNGANNKSPVAANAGGKGPVGNTVKPVKTGSDLGGRHDSSAYKNTVKDEIGRVGNTPGQSTQEPKAAPRPTLSQASGVNTKSILKQV